MVIFSPVLTVISVRSLKLIKNLKSGQGEKSKKFISEKKKIVSLIDSSDLFKMNFSFQIETCPSAGSELEM